MGRLAARLVSEDEKSFRIFLVSLVAMKRRSPGASIQFTVLLLAGARQPPRISRPLAGQNFPLRRNFWLGPVHAIVLLVTPLPQDGWGAVVEDGAGFNGSQTTHGDGGTPGWVWFRAGVGLQISHNRFQRFSDSLFNCQRVLGYLRQPGCELCFDSGAVHRCVRMPSQELRPKDISAQPAGNFGEIGGL